MFLLSAIHNARHEKDDASLAALNSRNPKDRNEAFESVKKTLLDRFGIEHQRQEIPFPIGKTGLGELYIERNSSAQYDDLDSLVNQFKSDPYVLVNKIREHQHSPSYRGHVCFGDLAKERGAIALKYDNSLVFKAESTMLRFGSSDKVNISLVAYQMLLATLSSDIEQGIVDPEKQMWIGDMPVIPNKDFGYEVGGHTFTCLNPTPSGQFMTFNRILKMEMVLVAAIYEKMGYANARAR